MNELENLNVSGIECYEKDGVVYLKQAKVADEFIPSIRKHGAYMTENTLDRMINSPEFGIKLLTALKEEQDKRKALEVANSELTVQNAIMAPKADYAEGTKKEG